MSRPRPRRLSHPRAVRVSVALATNTTRVSPSGADRGNETAARNMGEIPQTGQARHACVIDTFDSRLPVLLSADANAIDNTASRPRLHTFGPGVEARF
jgi:hypothetical protein